MITWSSPARAVISTSPTGAAVRVGVWRVLGAGKVRVAGAVVGLRAAACLKVRVSTYGRTACLPPGPLSRLQQESLDGSENSGPEEPETFPRDYVEQLRDENAKYRQRGRHADQLGQQLHTELVRATGRLADPSDLAYHEDHHEDPGALAAAIDDLLARKPHLPSRKPVGEIGQGATPSSSALELTALLRQRAR